MLVDVYGSWALLFISYVHSCCDTMCLTGFQSSGIYISNNSSLLMSKNNTEIAMRFSTSVKNGDSFYTDLNGFQVVAVFCLSLFVCSSLFVTSVFHVAIKNSVFININ